MAEEVGTKTKREMMNSAGKINYGALLETLFSLIISDGAQREDKSIFVIFALMHFVTNVCGGTLEGNI